MKTRARLKKIRESKSLRDQNDLARDTAPWTTFDRLFDELTDWWILDSIDKPDFDAAVRMIANPTRRRLAVQAKESKAYFDRELADDPEYHKDLADQATGRDEFFKWLGYCIADACIKGKSGLLRDMANALDTWTRHTPTPDRLRAALLTLKPRSTPWSMRELCMMLPRFGIMITDDSRRIIRRIAKEIGMKIKGDPGRPRSK